MEDIQLAENIDDYLQQGIHGQKQTKPDERRKFLGSLRERVVIALKQPQMREDGIYPQVEEAIKANRKAHLYLNGNMSYSYLSKYIKLASANKVEYTIVTNKDHNSEIGLVLAYDYAIDKPEIFVERKTVKAEAEKPKKGGLFAKLFKRK
ncbi:hypothetical protein KIS4809_5174 [Bacillus sp. ZZV12-4809]|nr:hypothetical protein KIS4809_5174 [Bacillus sp. ZZV12-4809]